LAIARRKHLTQNGYVCVSVFTTGNAVKRFWILDLRFWIDPVHKGTGLGDFRLSILDLFRPNMAGLEPKNNSIFQNPKSQIGTVNNAVNVVITAIFHKFLVLSYTIQHLKYLSFSLAFLDLEADMSRFYVIS
jgi:hypothetical protein